MDRGCTERRPAVKRGNVYRVSLEPAHEGARPESRPAVIVSHDVSNRILDRVQVAPLTPNTGRLYPSEALVMVNGLPLKAMADLIQTVAKSRLGAYLGAVSGSDMVQVEDALRRQLGLG